MVDSDSAGGLLIVHVLLNPQSKYWNHFPLKKKKKTTKNMLVQF